MDLQSTYEKNIERIKTLKPNCAQRFLKFLDACWSKKLYFIIPKEGALRTEEDQLLLLTKGRTKEDIEKTYRKLGLTIDQLTKIRTLYIQKKNVIADRPVTWTIHSNHRGGTAIDCLPAILTNKGTLELQKDGLKVRAQLQEMDLLATTIHCGVYRPVSTILAKDFAHWEAYDKPIEISKEAQKLIDKRNERIKQRLSTTP